MGLPRSHIHTQSRARTHTHTQVETRSYKDVAPHATDSTARAVAAATVFQRFIEKNIYFSVAATECRILYMYSFSIFPLLFEIPGAVILPPVRNEHKYNESVSSY